MILAVFAGHPVSQVVFPVFVRLVVPLLLWALFVLAVSLFDRHADRRAERPADDAEQAAEPPDIEPPEDTLLAA